MATGTVKWFRQALLDIGKGLHNLSTADLRLGVATAAVVPTQDTADPHWGGTGTTNMATNQVALATGYAGPIVLTGESWTLVSGVPTLRADIVTIAQDASGFTNAGYAYVYDNTDANKRCLGYVELAAAGNVSNVGGPVEVNWSGASNDVLTLTGI